MILETPILHFNEDLQRAIDLFNHASTMPQNILKDDILRASYMMAVGALDAFFCDACADLISRTYRAKMHQPDVNLPEKMSNLKLPAIVFLEKDVNSGWLWRSIANDIVEKDNVLSIKKIKLLFNHFFRPGHKLFVDTDSPIDRWIMSKRYRRRLFGFSQKDYRASSGTNKNTLKKQAIIHLGKRYNIIFQRRHDCIHNCDRPKYSISSISVKYVEKEIDDIQLLVYHCYDELLNEFPIYLRRLGFSSSTRNFVGV